MATCKSCKGTGNKRGVSDSFRKDMEKLLPEGGSYKCDYCGGSGKVPDKPEPSRPLTVNELIALLEKVPDRTMTVITEGCDCYGDAVNVELQHGQILITRSN